MPFTKSNHLNNFFLLYLEYNSKSWISKEGVEINLIDYNNKNNSPGIWRCYYNQELGLWMPI